MQPLQTAKEPWVKLSQANALTLDSQIPKLRDLRFKSGLYGGFFYSWYLCARQIFMCLQALAIRSMTIKHSAAINNKELSLKTILLDTEFSRLLKTKANLHSTVVPCLFTSHNERHLDGVVGSTGCKTSSTFFIVDQYFDFMIVEAKNTTWHEYVVKIKKRKYI